MVDLWPFRWSRWFLEQQQGVCGAFASYRENEMLHARYVAGRKRVQLSDHNHGLCDCGISGSATSISANDNCHDNLPCYPLWSLALASMCFGPVLEGGPVTRDAGEWILFIQCAGGLKPRGEVSHIDLLYQGHSFRMRYCSAALRYCRSSGLPPFE